MKDKLVEPHDRYYGPDHHIWNNNGTWWCHLTLPRMRGQAMPDSVPDSALPARCPTNGGRVNSPLATRHPSLRTESA
jgi:hypothetical protein